jgi:hypothetical protein
MGEIPFPETLILSFLTRSQESTLYVKSHVYFSGVASSKEINAVAVISPFIPFKDLVAHLCGTVTTPLVLLIVIPKAKDSSSSS